LPAGGLDHLCPSLDLLGQEVIRHRCRIDVAERVRADLVTVGKDPLENVFLAGDRVPEDEERRGGLVLSQQIEDGRRPDGRAVVEGECDQG
jgi:hypothetical protein